MLVFKAFLPGVASTSGSTLYLATVYIDVCWIRCRFMCRMGVILAGGSISSCRVVLCRIGWVSVTIKSFYIQFMSFVVLYIFIYCFQSLFLLFKYICFNLNSYYFNFEYLGSRFQKKEKINLVIFKTFVCDTEFYF